MIASGGWGMFSACRRGLVACLLLTMLSSCQTTGITSGQTEEEIRQLLPGAWHVISKNGKEVTYSEKTFYADGTAKGFVRGRLMNSGVAMYTARINFSSRWKLEGQKMIVYDMRSPDSDLFDPRDVHHDRIISISPERIEYENFDGERFSYLRGPLD